LTHINQALDDGTASFMSTQRRRVDWVPEEEVAGRNALESSSDVAHSAHSSGETGGRSVERPSLQAQDPRIGWDRAGNRPTQRALAGTKGAFAGSNWTRSQGHILFLVFDRSDRRETLVPVTSAEAARRTVVKLNTKNRVCHREATKLNTKNQLCHREATIRVLPRGPRSVPRCGWPL
jgi:hypothetical protein